MSRNIRIGMITGKELPAYIPQKMIGTELERGKYLVVYEDGFNAIDEWMGESWRYSHNDVVAYYLPKLK